MPLLPFTTSTGIILRDQLPLSSRALGYRTQVGKHRWEEGVWRMGRWGGTEWGARASGRRPAWGRPGEPRGENRRKDGRTDKRTARRDQPWLRHNHEHFRKKWESDTTLQPLDRKMEKDPLLRANKQKWPRKPHGAPTRDRATTSFPDFSCTCMRVRCSLPLTVAVTLVLGSLYNISILHLILLAHISP